jgi:hypothetical protein
VLRSKSAALRGSLSSRRRGADPAAVSEAAMGLLLRLDAIQVMETVTRISLNSHRFAIGVLGFDVGFGTGRGPNDP